MILTGKMLIYEQAEKNICCVTKLNTTYPLDQHPQYEADIHPPWIDYYL